MNTLMLCDRGSDAFDGLDLRALVEAAGRGAGGEVAAIELSAGEIRPCRGCFMCWVRTPGLCIMDDDCANAVSGRLVRSDVVVLLSRITYGGLSQDVKALLDRLIPNISPFFEMVSGEMHHRARYERFPTMVAIGYGATTPRERETFVALAGRNALNMKAARHYSFTPEDAGQAADMARALGAVLALEAHA